MRGEAMLMGAVSKIYAFDKDQEPGGMMAERLLILLAVALALVAGWAALRLWRAATLRRLQTSEAPAPLRELVPAGKPAVVAFSAPHCHECHTRQAPAFHRRIPCGGTVVERPEPLVERDRPVGVVDLEVLVVEVVGIATGVDRPTEQLDLVEPGVAGHGRHHQVERVEHGVDRVRRHDPVDRHGAEVEQAGHGPGAEPEEDETDNVGPEVVCLLKDDSDARHHDVQVAIHDGQVERGSEIVRSDHEGTMCMRSHHGMHVAQLISVLGCQ